MELFPIPGADQSAICGPCNLCCTLMGIDDMPDNEPTKPAGVPCHYLSKGGCGGCSIYAHKPSSCSTYECFWHGLKRMDMQRGSEMTPDELRPDICHAVINPLDEDKGLAVTIDPAYPNAWQQPHLNRFLLDMITLGMTVILEIGIGTYRKMRIDGSLEPMVVVEPTEHGKLLMTLAEALANGYVTLED